MLALCDLFHGLKCATVYFVYRILFCVYRMEIVKKLPQDLKDYIYRLSVDIWIEWNRKKWLKEHKKKLGTIYRNTIISTNAYFTVSLNQPFSRAFAISDYKNGKRYTKLEAELKCYILRKKDQKNPEYKACCLNPQFTIISSTWFHPKIWKDTDDE